MIAETIFFTVEMRPIRTRFYHDHEQGRPRGRVRAFPRKRQRARASTIHEMPDMRCRHVPGVRASIAPNGGYLKSVCAKRRWLGASAWWTCRGDPGKLGLAALRRRVPRLPAAHPRCTALDRDRGGNRFLLMPAMHRALLRKSRRAGPRQRQLQPQPAEEGHLTTSDLQKQQRRSACSASCNLPTNPPRQALGGYVRAFSAAITPSNRAPPGWVRSADRSRSSRARWTAAERSSAPSLA